MLNQFDGVNHLIYRLVNEGLGLSLRLLSGMVSQKSYFTNKDELRHDDPKKDFKMAQSFYGPR